MAEALVSILLERLGSFFFQDGEQEVRPVVGVEEEVQNLTRNLHVIQAVLDDAERRHMTEPTVKRWLDKLKDVCYDTDNVLDECNTVVQTEVLSSISSLFCCRQVAVRHNIAIKIKELNKKLDDIVNERSKFNFALKSDNHLALTSDNERFARQITASVVDVSKVYGRDQDKNTIVDMLLSESSQGPTLRTISMVGMGGIGKTTLAQLVYNDDVVKAHFQKRIWVCVSDTFDEIKIAKAILGALSYDAPNINELEPLLQQIHHSIEGKKLLLVLDDVWTEDYERFEQLKHSLMCDSLGSRILVTTRMESIAIFMGTKKTDMFCLGLLSKDECWSLFTQFAFSGRSSKECENLEDIGWRIADKCNGLPLAAKVLGTLLCFKRTRDEWESVLDSEVWKLEEAQRGIFSSLLLSYYDLPVSLRQCFLYCAIFPNGYEIEKDRLIKLWMAQGYLKVTRARDMEIIGDEYIEKFIMKSFFEDVERDSSGTIITFQVNSKLHEFARFLTEKECSMIEVYDRFKVNFPNLNVRHSMFILEGDVSIFAPIKYVKNLCSLIVEYKSLPPTGATSFQVLDKFTRLRAFDLSACNYHETPLKKLSKEVGKLIHLRYLNLAYNDELEELPETMCDLCNLQSLNVSHCMSLKNLPRGLGRLINLRHLEISSTGVSFMPRGVERLTSLRTLDTFYVSSAGNVDEASTLEDLKNLNHLRGHLEIRGLGKVRNVNEVKNAQLENKKHLIGLVLDFSGEEAEEGRMRNGEQVIEALQPPPNLEELSIYGYKSTSVSPSWMMSLTNLKKVKIGFCWNCEVLSALGKLPSLESLYIVDMPGVERVGIELLGIESEVKKNEGPSSSSSSSLIAFPKLKELTFEYMENWEEWEDYGMRRRMGDDITTTTNITIMPCLHSLEIMFCPMLKALPEHLLLKYPSLKELKIYRSPILSERYYKERKGEVLPNISRIHNIIIDHKYVQRDGQPQQMDHISQVYFL